MKCIGATTFTEYRGIFEKDAALSRRFQKIDVVEPSVEQTIEILKGLKSRFEEHHSVKYALGALQAAAELSASTSTTATCRQGHRRDRRGRCGAAHPPEEQAEEDHHRAPRSRTSSPRSRASRRPRCQRRPQQAQDPGPRPEERGVRPGPGHRCAGGGHQDGALGPGQARQADRLLPVQRPHRRRQDRGRQAAGLHPGHRADPLRHVRSTWSATR